MLYYSPMLYDVLKHKTGLASKHANTDSSAKNWKVGTDQKKSLRVGDRAQLLRAPAAVAEDLGSVPQHPPI